MLIYFLINLLIINLIVATNTAIIIYAKEGNCLLYTICKRAIVSRKSSIYIHYYKSYKLGIPQLKKSLEDLDSTLISNNIKLEDLEQDSKIILIPSIPYLLIKSLEIQKVSIIFIFLLNYYKIY